MVVVLLVTTVASLAAKKPIQGDHLYPRSAIDASGELWLKRSPPQGQ
jgi:hypothetical protein